MIRLSAIAGISSSGRGEQAAAGGRSLSARRLGLTTTAEQAVRHAAGTGDSLAKSDAGGAMLAIHSEVAVVADQELRVSHTPLQVLAPAVPAVDGGVPLGRAVHARRRGPAALFKGHRRPSFDMKEVTHGSFIRHSENAP